MSIDSDDWPLMPIWFSSMILDSDWTTYLFEGYVGVLSVLSVCEADYSADWEDDFEFELDDSSIEVFYFLVLALNVFWLSSDDSRVVLFVLVLYF